MVMVGIGLFATLLGTTWSIPLVGTFLNNNRIYF
jgi:hypothetical protein